MPESIITYMHWSRNFHVLFLVSFTLCYPVIVGAVHRVDLLHALRRSVGAVAKTITSRLPIIQPLGLG